MTEAPKKKGGIKADGKTYVWVKDAALAKDALYIKGLVKAIDEEKHKVSVEASNGTKCDVLDLPIKECHEVCPGDDVNDHCQLMYLSEPTLLENTRRRFEKDQIHTYVGEILVVVNPFKGTVQCQGHPVLSDAVKAMCVNKKLLTAECGPHIYSMAEKAYVQLQTSEKKVKHLQSQCVVVSGESGAGKTEGNRALMNYLIYRGSAGGAPSDLTEKIMTANPILESFGNAKTMRNNNSSRFGRYTLMRFDKDWGVSGAQVRVFLLERSRVTSTFNEDERSYHAFYQLIKAGTQYIAPNDCKAHTYTSFEGTAIDSPGINDTEWFADCNKGFASIAVSPSEVDVMWGYVAAMLLMGNIDFGTGDHAAISDTETLHALEEKLGITNGTQMLTMRSFTSVGKTDLLQQEPSRAATARDALVKIMYARLFNWIVVRVNQTIDASGDTSQRYIGLLDVYGFEFFAVNSFEQLCINFANEKLQQFFLKEVFDNEVNTYKVEGVEFTPIPFKDNSDIIKLCEEKKKGIYDILDDQCKSTSTTGLTFCAALHKEHGNMKGTGDDPAPFAKLKLGKRKGGGKETRSNNDHFIVNHFAGEVVYFAGEFIEKNNDKLDPEAEKVLLSSSLPLVVTIATPEGGVPDPKAKKGVQTLGKKFVQSLDKLMEDLKQSNALFVRCIKPNPEKVPNKINGKSVIDQLRQSGTLDAVRLIQKGYPARIPYDLIHSNYSKVLADVPGIDIASLSPSEFCEAIAEACDVAKSEYQLGTTRMFFRMGAAAFLEELAEADPEEMKPKLIEMFAVFEQKRKAKPVMEKTVLMWMHKRKYPAVAHKKRAIDQKYYNDAMELKAREDERLAQEKAEEDRRREQEAKVEAAKKAEAEAEAAEEANSVAGAGAAAAKATEAEAGAATAAVAVTAEDTPVKETADEAAPELEPKAQAAVADTPTAVTPPAAPIPFGKGALSRGKTVKQLKVEGATHSLEQVSKKLAAIEGEPTDAALENAVAAGGGLGTIIELAKENKATAEVCKQFADLVHELSMTDAMARELKREGAIDLLVEAAQRHHDSTEVQMTVANAIRNLCDVEEIALGMDLEDEEKGVHVVLTDAFARNMDSEDVVCNVAGAFWALSFFEKTSNILADPKKGITKKLIEAANKHPKSEETVHAVAGTLRNLSASRLGIGVRQAISDHEGVEMLVRASFMHRESTPVVSQVALALKNLAENDDVAEYINGVGGTSALIQMSKEHPKSSKVQAAVAGALKNLAVNDEIVKGIVEAGGIPALVQAADAHPGVADVQAEVAMALWGLAISEDIETKIVEMEAIESLVRACSTHLQKARVVAAVANALRKLTQATAESKEQVAQHNGIVMLISASDYHLTNEDVQAGVAGLLSNLSVTLEDQIAKANGIDCLLKAAREHPKSEKVHERIMRALTNLSDHEWNKAFIASSKGVSTIIESAKQHADSAGVQAGISGALRNLSVSPSIAKEMVNGGAIPILVSVTMHHHSSGAVMGNVCAVLRTLALSQSYRKKIIEAGGIAAVDAAITFHRGGNEDLIAELQGARADILFIGEAPGGASYEKKPLVTQLSRQLSRSVSRGKGALARSPSPQGGGRPPPPPSQGGDRKDSPRKGRKDPSPAGQRPKKEKKGWFSSRKK